MTTSSNLNLISGGLALPFHSVKRDISYRSMDCAYNLSQDSFQDSNLAKTMSYGLTKAEAVVTNVVAPRNVQDFNNVLKDKANSRKVFPAGTDASNNKTQVQNKTGSIVPIIKKINMPQCTLSIVGKNVCTDTGFFH